MLKHILANFSNFYTKHEINCFYTENLFVAIIIIVIATIAISSAFIFAQYSVVEIFITILVGFILKDKINTKLY